MTQSDYNDLPNSCFTASTFDLDTAVIVEFFLSATINPSVDGVKVTEIVLNRDGVPVALASAAADNTMGNLQASNFNIIYKELIPAGTDGQMFNIQLFQSAPEENAAGTTNVIFDSGDNNLGLMWGYKVYATELTTLDTAPVCGG